MKLCFYHGIKKKFYFAEVVTCHGYSCYSQTYEKHFPTYTFFEKEHTGFQIN